MSWSQIYKTRENIKYSTFSWLLFPAYSEPTDVNSIYLTKLLMVLIWKTDKNLGQLPLHSAVKEI